MEIKMSLYYLNHIHNYIICIQNVLCNENSYVFPPRELYLKKESLDSTLRHNNNKKNGKQFRGISTLIHTYRLCRDVECNLKFDKNKKIYRNFYIQNFKLVDRILFSLYDFLLRIIFRCIFRRIF